jgi:hypothetical protein
VTSVASPGWRGAIILDQRLFHGESRGHWDVAGTGTTLHGKPFACAGAPGGSPPWVFLSYHQARRAVGSAQRVRQPAAPAGCDPDAFAAPGIH